MVLYVPPATTSNDHRAFDFDVLGIAAFVKFDIAEIVVGLFGFVSHSTSRKGEAPDCQDSIRGLYRSRLADRMGVRGILHSFRQ